MSVKSLHGLNNMGICIKQKCAKKCTKIPGHNKKQVLKIRNSVYRQLSHCTKTISLHGKSRNVESGIFMVCIDRFPSSNIERVCIKFVTSTMGLKHDLGPRFKIWILLLWWNTFTVFIYRSQIINLNNGAFWESFSVKYIHLTEQMPLINILEVTVNQADGLWILMHPLSHVYACSQQQDDHIFT